jgi:hypothetical protein
MSLFQVDKTYKEKEKVRRKLAHAEAVYAAAQKKDTEKAKRPQHKIGFLGLVGEKVRSCSELGYNQYTIFLCQLSSLVFSVCWWHRIPVGLPGGPLIAPV